MAYINWLIGTSAITSTSKLGLTGGWWIKLPDSAPPIQWLQTTSITLPTSGEYRGVVVELIDTTTVGHVIHMDARGVEEYEKNGKWLRLRSDPALSNQAADKVERMYTRVHVYYRNAAEMGPVP